MIAKKTAREFLLFWEGRNEEEWRNAVNTERQRLGMPELEEEEDYGYDPEENARERQRLEQEYEE